MPDGSLGELRVHKGGTRLKAGWECKRLIDAGRVDFIRRELGMNAELVVYCDESVSPENVLLLFWQRGAPRPGVACASTAAPAAPRAGENGATGAAPATATAATLAERKRRETATGSSMHEGEPKREKIAAAPEGFTKLPTLFTHSGPWVGWVVPHSAHSRPPDVGWLVPHSPHTYCLLHT